MLRPVLWVAIALISLLSLSSCTPVSAEDRLFAPMSLEFLGEYTLPPQTVDGIPVGGLSAIAYDRARDRYYALSDDSSRAAARFYTLRIDLASEDTTPSIANVVIESVTRLTSEAIQEYTTDSLDPEGIAITPRQTLYIATEGSASQSIPPAIDEFDRATGQHQRRLPIPQRLVPQTIDERSSGVGDNLGFESLTLLSSGSTVGNGSGDGYVEPFRVFAAIEAPLQQDLPAANADGEVPVPLRLLHYLVADDRSTLLAEHRYDLDPAPDLAIGNGLTEILVLDQAGHFLSLERAYGLFGFSATLFQFVIADATDISGIPRLIGDISTIQPVRKQLAFALSDLVDQGIRLDNLEGMTLGARLPDGSQSLLLVSDDNFRPEQSTQFLLFRLRM
ncbi:MAG: esterase-like activity of phytase family protein [Kaiparowitsia implicata GSE-PSE-MK54-09C]|jgi:hypothetical protein|nr:esterase-like activity of phytase family protein [Kaiparowitsia implicata GSE-PSE-MK54-09C]